MFGNVNTPGLANVYSLKLDKALVYLVSGGNNFRGEFKETEAYEKGDVIIADTQNGPRFMQAVETNGPDTYDSSKWAALTMSSGGGSDESSTSSNVKMVVYNEETGQYEETSYSSGIIRLAIEDATDGSFVEPTWSGNTNPTTEVYNEGDQSWSVLPSA